MRQISKWGNTTKPIHWLTEDICEVVYT